MDKKRYIAPYLISIELDDDTFIQTSPSDNGQGDNNLGNEKPDGDMGAKRFSFSYNFDDIEE